MRAKASLALVLVLMTGCLSDSVQLQYRFEEGDTTTYRMVAEAVAEWDIAGAGEGSYTATFDVTETVESVDASGAIVTVEMIPLPDGTEENGLPSPGLDRRSFVLRLGPDGELLGVLEVDDIAAAVLDQDDLAFIGTYRPPLPEDRVSLQDVWSEEREIQLGSTFQAIGTTGELTAFRRSGSALLARIAFTGTSPLEWATALPQGDAQLVGEAATDGTALFDLDSGRLQEASSSTVGNFTVRVLPGGGDAPIPGTLRLDLKLTVERVG